MKRYNYEVKLTIRVWLSGDSDVEVIDKARSSFFRPTDTDDVTIEIKEPSRQETETV